MTDAVDAYLAELRVALTRRGIDPGRTVEEAEEHLRDLQAAIVADGHADATAARLAVERFGGARRLAGAMPDGVAPGWTAVGLPVAAVLIAVGVGGVVDVLAGAGTTGGAGGALVRLAAGVAGMALAEVLLLAHAAAGRRPYIRRNWGPPLVLGLVAVTAAATAAVASDPAAWLATAVATASAAGAFVRAGRPAPPVPT